MRNTMNVIMPLCAGVTATLVVSCGLDPGGTAAGRAGDIGRTAQALATDGQVCITVQRGAGTAGAADAVIWENAPTWNDGANPTLSTGTSEAGGFRRSLIRFDIPSLPSGASVVSASLSLSQTYKTVDSTVRVHRVTSAWDEATVTWASFGDAFDPAIVGSFTSGGGVGIRSVDVTPLARAWVSGDAPNYGLLLDEDPVLRTDYHSSENALLERQPKLELCYVTCDDGIQNGDEEGVDCGGSCAPCGGQPPECVDTASVTQVRPFTLFVAFDRSTSMGRSPFGTDVRMSRWIPATSALKDFFSDPESAGLGVAFRFWPHDNPGSCINNICPPPGGGGCALPLVPFDGTTARRLTAAPAPFDQQELALISAIDSFPIPSGDTPMYPALDGATTWAINYKNAHPTEEVAVVFITDGNPSHCNTNPDAIANLALNAFQNHGVRVHAVGFGDASAALIHLIAERGGGQAYSLTTGATLRAELRDALTSIRSEASPCELTIPDAGAADPALVSVVYENAAGSATTLTRRSGPGACGGGGWYFTDATSTRVKLCPETCADVRASAGGEVRAIVTCPADTPLP